mmetsp:Transcript_4215/g.13407  ORF Transcript_4215/g.13407 Transcript_4215/m.13407 type:complete len:213 (-) Transcript_4215:115-753(-)
MDVPHLVRPSDHAGVLHPVVEGRGGAPVRHAHECADQHVGVITYLAQLLQVAVGLLPEEPLLLGAQGASACAGNGVRGVSTRKAQPSWNLASHQLSSTTAPAGGRGEAYQRHPPPRRRRPRSTPPAPNPATLPPSFLYSTLQRGDLRMDRNVLPAVLLRPLLCTPALGVALKLGHDLSALAQPPKPRSATTRTRPPPAAPPRSNPSTATTPP